MATLNKPIPEISVVVPVYRGQECLDELYQRISNALKNNAITFEIILVDDQSPDNSWSKIEELAKKDSAVRGFRFSRNFGQHNAITAGVDFSLGKWIVVMDCDLQDRPEDIVTLYVEAQKGFDVVVARRGRRQDPILRRATSRFFYFVFRILSGMKYDHEVGNFRIISRQVANELNKMREQIRFFGGLIEWLGFKVGTVNVIHSDRFAGESSYNWPRLIQLAGRFIIAHSERPLKFTIYVGFLMSAVSLSFGAYIVLRTIGNTSPIQGWASLIVSLYFIGGLILATLGMMGVYLGKVFQEVKGRPLYVIRAKTDSEN